MIPPTSDQRFARRIVAGYLIVQAAATLAWWVCLVAVPASIAYFQPTHWPDAALLSFWLPDLSIIVVGSVLTAWGVIRGKTWASLAIWSLAAAAWYATLYCIGCSVLTGQAWIAAGLMTCMSGLTLAMATIFGQPTEHPATFRTTPMHAAGALMWSLLQLIIFWSVFLWILPMGLREFQLLVLGIPTFTHAGQSSLATGLFLCASGFGLWSCWTLSRLGRGTPLPTANAPELVIAGPYRLVRNPMALAGILQGLAVGWYLGSWLTIFYAGLGAVLWHWVVRPVEEAELAQRFGKAYCNYQQSIPLWVPLWAPRVREPFR